ncbi:hypothetical protein ACFQX6_63175 [Streptosporangium lutulentum]
MTPTDWSNQWAVSQASPMRRVHIRGTLWLEPGNAGFSSGGYIADSKVDGITINGSQQQWLTRDSELGDAWTNGVWNQVFSGVTGAPPTGFPNPPYTTLPTSPVTREKPFLHIDDSGDYRVFVPSLRHNTSGTTWADGRGRRDVAADPRLLHREAVRQRAEDQPAVVAWQAPPAHPGRLPSRPGPAREEQEHGRARAGHAEPGARHR